MQEWGLSHEGIITSSQTFLSWIFCVFLYLSSQNFLKKNHDWQLDKIAEFLTSLSNESIYDNFFVKELSQC